jgi:hypothetical protein
MPMDDLQNAAHGDGAQWCAAPAGIAPARAPRLRTCRPLGTPVLLGADWSRSVASSLKWKCRPRNSGLASRRAARCWWRSGLLREKIIGHSVCSIEPRFRPGGGVRDLRRTLALLHQPARQHGRGVFFQPLVQQGTDLLAEIGGMTQTRQFVGLQRVARSGQKKLPRRLGVVPGHGILLWGQEFHSNTVVIPFKDNQSVNVCGKVWKTARRFGGGEGAKDERIPRLGLVRP